MFSFIYSSFYLERKGANNTNFLHNKISKFTFVFCSAISTWCIGSCCCRQMLHKTDLYANFTFFAWFSLKSYGLMRKTIGLFTFALATVFVVVYIITHVVFMCSAQCCSVQRSYAVYYFVHFLLSDGICFQATFT